MSWSRRMSSPDLGQVRDVNAYTLSALVEQVGGVPCAFWHPAGSGG